MNRGNGTRQVRRDGHGFTLIELLVVIAILGILAGVVVFSVRGVDDKGERAATLTDRRTVLTAQEAYRARFGTYATEKDLVKEGFLADESTQTDVVFPSPGDTSSFILVPQESTDGELVVGVPSDTFNFGGSNPAGINSNFGMFPYNTNMFETLVRMTPDFRVDPWLATSWELPGQTPPGAETPLGPNTFRFHLRSGVRFHDGSPMTSADVVYSLNTRTASNGGLRFAPSSAVAVDAATVDITLTGPNNRLVEQLVHPSIKPVFKAGTVPASGAANVTAMGTGPFEFASYSQGNQLVVVRNDDYWGDEAKLAKLTFRFFSDSNTRLLALQSGDVDLIYDVPKDSLAAVRATPGLEAAVAPPGANEMIWVNSHRTDDPATPGIREDALSSLAVTTPGMPDGQRVRKAIAAAIDRASVIAATWPQGAVLADTMIPAALLKPYEGTVTGPAFDLGEAAAQLDAAGWRCTGTCGPGNLRTKGGATLTVRLLNGYTPTSLRGDADLLVENALEAVGIDVDRQRLGDTSGDQTIYGEALASGDRDLYMERIAQNDANPTSPPTSFFDCTGGTFNTTPSAGGGNCSAASGLPDYPEAIGPGAAFQTLIAEARAAATPDEARQKTAAAIHEAMDNYVAGIHLASVNWLYGMKSDVQGFVLHGSIRHVRWATVYRSGG
ncbi:MAG TPA: ABC transporter substrate-binding protein [Acidimicrobiales bacterium]|nr:ABC transporter substrate-binding protein [Acidimicrobiales bacterium]